MLMFVYFLCRGMIYRASTRKLSVAPLCCPVVFGIGYLRVDLVRQNNHAGRPEHDHGYVRLQGSRWGSDGTEYAFDFISDERRHAKLCWHIP